MQDFSKELNTAEIIKLRSWSNFQPIYDKYVTHYNDNHIEASANFSSILSGAEQLVQEKWNEFDFAKRCYHNEIHDIISIRESEPKESYLFTSSQEELVGWKDQLFDLEEVVFDPSLPLPEDIKERHHNKLNLYLELFDNIVSSLTMQEQKDYLCHQLHDVIDAYKSLLRIETNRQALKAIINKVLCEAYPRLKATSQMSGKEKEAIKESTETRGRKPKAPKVKANIKSYYKENRERLEKENTDSNGYPIKAQIADTIIKEKDEDFGIKDNYKDATRTVTECINNANEEMRKSRNA